MHERADVSIIPNAEQALQQQTADFVAWERRRIADSHRFYEKYEELIVRHKEIGTVWSRLFDPIEKASFDVWRTREIGEIPLMPVE